jgi:hypothetical protein
MGIARNLNGTAENSCRCDSWKTHLSRFGDEGISLFCAEITCGNIADVGGHVQIDNIATWFVIPLCKDHNNSRGTTFEIKNGVKKALANVAETCGSK